MVVSNSPFLALLTQLPVPVSTSAEHSRSLTSLLLTWVYHEWHPSKPFTIVSNPRTQFGRSSCRWRTFPLATVLLPFVPFLFCHLRPWCVKVFSFQMLILDYILAIWSSLHSRVLFIGHIFLFLFIHRCVCVCMSVCVCMCKGQRSSLSMITEVLSPASLSRRIFC